MDMSNKVEHLKMIESVITRMANNSLQIKCWSLAIFSAAIVLSRSVIIAACILPMVLFCYLDVCYLSVERSYRNLYEEVRQKKESEIDFSMKVSPVSKVDTFKSWSIRTFYILLIILLVIVSIINMFW